jgi:SAM-dependent methyltransferase
MTEQPTPPPAAADPTGPSGRPGSRPGRSYLPAMRRDWLLPLYDPLTRLLGVHAMHQRLVDQADLRPGLRVLEIGCGTGNLAVLIKRQHPGTTVLGLDPDPRALARAQRKARRAGLPIEFARGFADDLPYPPASVDRVFSALMLHHVDAADRPAALREVARVLAPGGSLHVVDIAASPGPAGRPSARPLARLAHRPHRHGHGHGHGGAGDDIPTLIRAAGLTDPRETGHGANPLGSYTYYRADR